MRKTLLLFLLSLTGCLGMSAQGTTENSEGTLEISSLVSLQPGVLADGEKYFTIKLKAPAEDKLYTAYQMDIYLPDGVLFDNAVVCDIYYSACDIYPYTQAGRGEKKWPHTLTYQLHSSNHARVIVKSDGNDAFKSNEGDIFDVYVKATPFAKPGDFQVTIKDIKFVSPDETKYLYKDQVLTAGTVSAESTLPIKVTSANKISTAIFPFSCDIPEGLEVYAATGDDGEYITLGKQESITAFIPYILYAENGIDQNLQGTIDAANYPASTSVSDGPITGVICDTQVSAGYVLQNKGEGPKFHKIGSTPFTIPAGKCYANPRAANAPSLTFLFGDKDVDGIQSTPALPVQIQNNVYDLQGKRVLNPQSGYIYVINGQKVLKR